jgi:tetratricopeptide (TPR) repeat protein
MESAKQGPLGVFISYAHEDDELCQEFIKHLIQIKRDGLIRAWHDRRLTGGSEWAGQIDEHLNSADIVVLLVSPDFLASQYCYDIEMKRALERDAAGEARVVPVILRSCDWQTSQFAKLTALPEDGKPVVKWETHDDGFLDVVKRLRRVVRELREPVQRGGVPAPPPLDERPVVRKIRLWHLVVVGVMILMIAGWFWWDKQREYVAQGDGSLNVGRYEDACAPYQRALRLNPGNRAAVLGLEIVDLAKLKPDPVNFEGRLKQLLKEAPKDPYLKVLEGDYLAGLGRLDDAMSRYKEAAKLDQGLAEAYFRMGVLYDQRRDIAHALTMHKRAVELAPSSPQYACNLADQYFKHGEYTEGIRVYGGIREFPLAALESAKIYRLLGDLKAANDLERVAIGWMGEPAVAKSPESRLPWSIESGGAQPVSLSTGGAQLCYAHLEFSATLYLDGDEAHAREQSERAARDCGARLGAVKATVRWELERVAQEQGDLAGRATTYSRRFLTE